MMRLFCVLCATLAWRARGQVRIEASVAPMEDLFHNFQAYNATQTDSTKAFASTFGLEKLANAASGSVWPYVLKVRGDILKSTSATDYLLKTLFEGNIPQYHVLDKSHVQVFLGHDQRPLADDLDQLIIHERSLPSEPLSILPIGTRIGFHIFEQIANTPPTGATGKQRVRLLVTLLDSSTRDAFTSQTKRDLSAPDYLASMKPFWKTEKNPEGLAKPVEAPSARFTAVTITESKSSNRVAVDVELKQNQDKQEATLYLSFYFARNLAHVSYVAARPEDYPLAADEAAFIQRGPYRGGMCDPMHGHNLLGQGQIIGLIDTGIDLTSSYLYGPTGPYCEKTHSGESATRCGGVKATDEGDASSTSLDNDKFFYNNDGRVIVRYDAEADQAETTAAGHGTFLAGVIAGAPNPSKKFQKCQGKDHLEAKGAGRAHISFYDVGFDNKLALRTLAHDYKAMFRPAFAIGARLFTVAWGSGDSSFTRFGELTPKGKGQYTAAASDIDAFMYENQDALVVVAAGNSRPGFVTSPAISKNALTVGSLSASGTGVSSFSAGGKQPDGRMKPDLIAIGESVLSASSRGTKNVDQMSHCDITRKTGTSVSAALVTAAAAEVRQYFQEGYYPSGEASADGEFREDLWGSTVKAVLIAGAAPLTDQHKGGKLGTSEGYGSLVLSNVLPFSDDNQIDLDVTQGTISMGRPYEYAVQIESDEKPLVVTLVWTDPPAALGTQSPMVNNLELSIHEETFQRDWSTETNMDQTGTVKRFYIANPTPGNYKISVNPSFVRDEQTFSLVVTGRFSEKDRSSPTCCTGSTIPGVTGCLSLDAVICIVIVVIILVVLICGIIVLSCRRKAQAAEKAAAAKIQPL